MADDNKPDEAKARENLKKLFNEVLDERDAAKAAKDEEERKQREKEESEKPKPFSLLASFFGE